MKNNKKIGLALGGGAALGAAHIGVIKALEEFDISIDFVAGTSIGAFVSALFVFNKHWKEIQEIALDMNWLDISAISLSKMALLSNEKLGDLITEHIGDVNFDQANIPFAMIATDISNGDKIILKEGKVANAVMASTCIPGLFIPVDINNRLLVDGGIVENVPVTPLKEMGAEFIIGVDLNAEYSHKKPESIVEVLLNTFDFTLMNATKLQTEEADVLIKPDLSSFNLINTDQTKELIDKGYLAAKNVLKKMTGN
ncbi:MAG: patatin-like phospholipase family protein [Calditrichaceae bacterium]|jgi:NTE family protein